MRTNKRTITRKGTNSRTSRKILWVTRSSLFLENNLFVALFSISSHNCYFLLFFVIKNSLPETKKNKVRQFKKKTVKNIKGKIVGLRTEMY